MKIQMKLNGKNIQEEIRPDMLLLDLVRSHGCASVKRGCETANCGLCTVLLEDKPVLSCSLLAARADGAVHYKPLPRFPEVRRDLALVAEEEVSCAAVEQVIAESCKYVTAVHLFDVYRGEQIGAGKKSMAFSVTFTPRDKAIAPEDADGYVKRILKSLREKVGAELR